MIKVRNTTDSEIVLQGVLLRESGENDDTYEIPALDVQTWANDSEVIQNVANGNVIVSLNDVDVTDVARALNTLRGIGPTTEEGIPVSAPSFEYDFDLDGYFQGYLYTASAGVTSIFDELITTEIKLRAGWYEILDNNAAIGDYIDFSVVDKDDVLGLFGALGLTQGVDVLEVGNFVRTEYINPRNTGRSDFRVDGASTVFAGLYFRVKYVSTGANDVDFKVSYLVYED